MGTHHTMTPGQAATFTVALAVPGIFGFFCPGLLDVPKHDQHAVRQQQAKAAVGSLLLGAAGSAVTKTPWPFLLSLAISAFILWQYEQQHGKTSE
jgi:hypothetical protein